MNSHTAGIALALALLGSWFGEAAAQDRQPDRREIARYLRTLPAALDDGTLADAEALMASVPPEVGETLLLPDGNVRLTLARPVSARWLARTFGWELPIAVSGDVHQRSFSIMRGGVQTAPGRVSGSEPIAGVWHVRAVLKARPRGPLPRLRWAAAPAYDLRRVDAPVEHIFFTLQTSTARR